MGGVTILDHQAVVSILSLYHNNVDKAAHRLWFLNALKVFLHVIIHFNLETTQQSFIFWERNGFIASISLKPLWYGETVLSSLYIILPHYQIPFNAYLVQLLDMEKWMQQCKSTDNRHIIPPGYDIKCTAICALNGGLCQVEVSTRETRECNIRNSTSMRTVSNCLESRDYEMDRLSSPLCDVMWNISSATLEKPTNVAVPRLYIIYVSFESHLSTFRSLIVVHIVYCGRVFLYGEVLGIICLFYQSHGGSTKARVWLFCMETQ